MALKKNGKPKLGPRTHIGQKAVFFLPRQLDDSGEWNHSSQHNSDTSTETDWKLLKEEFGNAVDSAGLQEKKGETVFFGFF